MAIKAAIPNLLTISNLFFGCMAIVCTFSANPNDLYYVPYLVIAAALSDFLDGFAARLLNVSSDIGMQLDSLADMVTFGVVPGCVVYQLLFWGHGSTLDTHWLYLAPAFSLTIFAAIRLAKFNIDTRQTDGFIGLATPACTMFIMSLVLILEKNTLGLGGLVGNPYFLYAVIVLFSYLMVAEIPMFGLKFKHKSWEGNEIKYGFILGGLVALLVFGGLGIGLIVLSYILVSIYLFFVGKK